MKNFTKLFVVAICAAFATSVLAEEKEVALDLTNPTVPATITYDAEKLYWDQTFNTTDYPTIDFQIFKLQHSATHYSSGDAWNGFTISKNASEKNMISAEGGWTANQWGCMAKGGISDIEGGVPTVSADAPYLVAYYDYYSDLMTDTKSLNISFKDANTYTAKGVYIAAHPQAYYGVVDGDDFATAFSKDGDFLKITAHGVRNDVEGNTAEFILGEYNDGRVTALRGWQWFDLSSLGEVDEVYFTVEGSDMAYGFLNTASYFCMDRFTVTYDDTTGGSTLSAEVEPYRMGNTIYAIPSGAEVIVYNLAGQIIAKSVVTDGFFELPDSSASYITKIVTESGVQTVR